NRWFKPLTHLSASGQTGDVKGLRLDTKPELRAAREVTPQTVHGFEPTTRGRPPAVGNAVRRTAVNPVLSAIFILRFSILD
ncbi:MAG TPA: hypothetical protein VGH97_09820, partial [Thermoanaerobaculia bacterium]